MTPDIVAVFFVRTLMLARQNSASVISPSPTGISMPRTWKFRGTFHSLWPGRL